MFTTAKPAKSASRCWTQPAGMPPNGNLAWPPCSRPSALAWACWNYRRTLDKRRAQHSKWSYALWKQKHHNSTGEKGRPPKWHSSPATPIKTHQISLTPVSFGRKTCAMRSRNRGCPGRARHASNLRMAHSSKTFGLTPPGTVSLNSIKP